MECDVFVFVDVIEIIISAYIRDSVVLWGEVPVLLLQCE